MQDPTQEDPRGSEAAKHDLSYVSLDGNNGTEHQKWIKKFQLVRHCYLNEYILRNCRLTYLLKWFLFYQTVATFAFNGTYDQWES